ncbi:MAG TPA: hypothetical protein VMT67_16105 [Terriglobales bacterium]|nr:hypothetical protein [Terriglobales bacterium]
MTRKSAEIPVSKRLKAAMADLKTLQRMLASDDLDARLLSDFRDALNRVRNVAWAAQQSLAVQVCENDSTSIDSLLAAERVRAAYQLCRSIQGDLGREEIEFQKGQLAELQAVAAELTNDIKSRLS